MALGVRREMGGGDREMSALMNSRRDDGGK
jgi:hypothetical protein